MTAAGHETLLALGERYAAMGLGAAARAALLRARAVAPPADTRASRRLVELAVARGDGSDARGMAEEVVAGTPGPEARLLLGRALLESRDLDAARRAFSAALEAAAGDSAILARAHLGLGRVAAIRGDRSGAGAHAMAAVDAVIAWLADDAGDDALPLIDEAIGGAVAAERASDLMTAIAQAPRAAHYLRAVALASRQARGEAGIADEDIDGALRADLEERPTSWATRLLLAERMLRRRFREPAARGEAVAELTALTGALSDPDRGASNAIRARVWLMLAAAHEDDPASAERAEAAYRESLALQPANAAAAGRLAALILARGDHEGALAEVERALRIEPAGRAGWLNAARVLATARGADADDAVARLLDAAEPAASAAPASARLVHASNQIAREVVLHGVHARGHRLKNLLGIIGARVRSARRQAGGDAVGERLRGLELEVTDLYDEWAAYLRSLQSPSSAVIELVPVATLIGEVATAARERTAVPINTQVDDGLPDLRGDRLLLGEALLNVINNAAEACHSTEGQVDVVARQVRSGGSPVVEIEVADSGPGIARADLARIFSPGFTTKESGSGVGLVIAERVVASHHGRILVDSEVGVGTRVTLMLPSDLGGFAGLASFPLAQRGGGSE